MDKLQAMKFFVRVAEEGSFTGAAERMGVTTALVSRAVGGLETHLRTRLINRTTRRVALTEAGERYLSRCEQILAGIDLAEAEAADAHARPAGRLRVHATPGFGQSYVLPAVLAYRQSYPNVLVELTLSQHVPDLIDDGYDVSLQLSATDLPDSGLVSKRLGGLSSVLCASQAYLDAHGVPLDTHMLTEHACLQIVSSVFPNSHWQLTGPQGDVRFELPPAKLRVNTAEALAVALRAGAGVGALPMSTAVPTLRGGGLVRVLPDYTLQSLTAYALYPSRQYLDAKIRTFVESLQASIPMALEADMAALKVT
ncbi:LysR family transcriptional regulator [Burkholderia sp. Bp9143]|uniref:LysR family transcriptional regulator n=1 Tax=Burkholderia sp. Bp9143 TaxID=2184574 RepID=UPI000F5B86C7|nr:LysR family transcriptional regulator [Burkholderia sp. Bp9143]RQR29795.1 LysR family transcriptional regulator [Burkholderia sp. Bp9143]